MTSMLPVPGSVHAQAVFPNLIQSITFFSPQDCWKQVNVRKAVLPKLWSVLKNGGSGCATVIFPNLLPFLSKVPSEVCTYV